MNIVLANGDMKTINPQSDLWSGVQGAGHNFGIVTSVTSKIHDTVHANCAIETIIFSGDKVEAAYEAANEYILQGGKQSSDIINWSYWINDESLDADKVGSKPRRHSDISVPLLTVSPHPACHHHVYHSRRCQCCRY